MTNPEIHECKNELAKIVIKNDFLSFLQRSFYTLQNNTISDNWHINAISKYLSALYNNDINKLIINMPPRYLKSICVSIAWPAWILGHNPYANIIVASYSQSLSNKLSMWTRHIMQSEWYKNIFPDTILASDQNEKWRFNTTKNGFRFATSINGTLTGEGADFLIADDPISPLQAASVTHRQAVIDWFNNTFITRLNDKKSGKIVLVMQRLHEHDLSGHILSKNTKWDHLCIPSIAPSQQEIKINNFHYIRKAGEVLHNERENISMLNELKEQMGIYAFNAQYQQQPLQTDKAIIKKDWIKYQEFNGYIPYDSLIVQSWDTAINKNGDFTVCSTWIKLNNIFLLIDITRKKLEYPQLYKLANQLYDTYKPHAVIIENHSSGQQLIQQLQQDTSIPVISIKQKLCKKIRLMKILPIIESGHMVIAKNKTWNTELENELLTFPETKYDDQIDSITQYLEWAQNFKNLKSLMHKTHNKITVREL